MNKITSRWRMGILASAVALLASLASAQAHALALGRITVQSALGEPLRAEIDIADINADEASSLKAGVAPVETFKAAGFDYSAMMTDLEISLQRRADGRSFLRLTSRRPVTEPFVDLILQANWSTGRITRDYTMLFDPPNMRSGNSGVAVAPTAPILTRPVAPEAAPPARPIAAIPDARPTPPRTRSAPVAEAPAAKASPSENASFDNKQVTVKAGDTAGRIAAQNKPDGVSLDQMLVALLTSNPNAFIGDNINRLRAGAVLEIPGAQAASAVPPGEARQTIVAQSKDFNAFRRKLAEGVPTAKVASAERQAGGKVQASVEDRARANATPDMLTLSKGAIQGKPAATAEDAIAKERQAKDASTRVAELSKNINDLNKLEAAPALAPTPATSAAKAPGVPVPVPAPVAAPAASSTQTGNDTAAAAAVAASAVPPAIAAPVVSASRPAAPSAAVVPKAVAAKKPAATMPPPEPSLIDGLLENPLVLPLAGILLALLAGFGFYRYRQRRNTAQVDSSFLESRLQPDSFFGASGGQRIDTNDGNITGSSLVYSPSQLDAAGDVDPVAEADVYLAYGRDLQAEEILKEALHTHPTRTAIHAKLAEIYAKRRDKKAFEPVAIDALNLTQGTGPEWAYITEMGRELDPGNPMYQPGGQPDSAGAAALQPSGAAPAARPEQAPVPIPAVDVDLDFDLPPSDSLGLPTTPAAITAQLPTAPTRTPEPVPVINWDSGVGELDIGTATAALPELPSPPPPSTKAAAPSAPSINVPSDGLTFAPEPFTAPKPVPTPQKAAMPAAESSGSMLEFDLASLSLDLSEPVTESSVHALTDTPGDPLETRFQLAEEFRSLGDAIGARSLAEEVLAKSSGPLKIKAQAFLNALS